LWVSSAFDRGQCGNAITFIMRVDENWTLFILLPLWDSR
jgi:hypothetical protein